MIVYHGTTDRRARRIALEGFVPRKPSRRVWFAESRRYAAGRARTQARRSRRRPVVLTCDIDLNQMRRRYGAKRVLHRNRVIGISAPVPASVLRSCGAPLGQPSSPKELAYWVNRLLGVKPHKGVGASHPGILRLSRWVVNRVQSEPRRGVRRTELLHMARQWLPELLDGVEIGPESWLFFRPVKMPELELAPAPPEADTREDEAIGLLEDASPKRRIRGLSILAELEDPDLFEWCVMYLDDASANVRAAALRTMRRCEDGEPGVIVPLAESEDKRVRAAAIAALAVHAGRDAPRWFERGLKDPSPCVRLETAAVLSQLDPAEHRAVFELALYDPNPQVARLARKLTAGKGFSRVTSRPHP